MSDYIKGGRGKKAPYKTVHYRIPQPVKPTVVVLANQYRDLVANELEAEASAMLSKVNEIVFNSQQIENKLGTKFNETESEKAIDILYEALKLKANAGGAIKKRIKEALKILDS